MGHFKTNKYTIKIYPFLKVVFQHTLKIISLLILKLILNLFKNNYLKNKNNLINLMHYLGLIVIISNDREIYLTKV